MKKDFTEEIIEVLEENSPAMSPQDIAFRLSKNLPEDESISPKKVQLRVKDNPSIFEFENNQVSLIQEKAGNESFFNKVKSRLSSVVLYSKNSNLSYLAPSLLLFYRFKDLYKNKEELNIALNNYLLDGNSSDLKEELFDYFQKFENELSDKYQGYKRIFTNSVTNLDTLESDELFNLINDFSDLDLSKKNFSDSDFAEIYSHLIDYLSNAYKRELGEYLPDEIYTFISTLVSTEDDSRVYSPFITSANFFSKVHRNLFNNRDDVYFQGNVKNENLYYLTLQNFVSAGHDKFDLSKKDALEDRKKENFDIAISQLPLKQKRKNLNENAYYLTYGHVSSIQWHYLQKMIHSVGKKGKAIAILGANPLFNLQSKEIRSALVKENLVEVIIKLPNNTFNNTAISPFVLILNKDRQADTIFMADFSRKISSFSLKEFQNLSKKVSKSFHNYSELEGITRQVSGEEVTENDSNLNPGNYIHPEFSKVKEFFQGEDKKVFPLNDVVGKKVLGRFSLNEEEKNDENNELIYYQRTKFLSVRGIRKQRNVVDLKLSSLESIDDSGNDIKRHRSTIRSKAVVVSLFNDLNPIVFTPTTKNPSIILGNGVLALVPNKGVISAEYLHYQLSQEITQIQIELKQGGVIPRINIKDLFDIKIFVPNEKEQKKELFEFKKSIEEKKEREEKFKQKEKVIYANVRHSLKNQIGPISTDFNTIKEFLDGLQQDDKVFNWNLPIRSAMHAGEEVKNVDQLFKKINRKFSELNETLDKMEYIIGLSKSDIRLEVLPVGKIIHQTYDDLSFDPDNTELMIVNSKVKAPIAKSWFRKVIRNLLINADRHGRKEEGKLEIQFKIADTEDDFVRIFYTNNGKPFPPGFNFEKFKGFQETVGDQGGSGLGGYLINRVIESHGGSIRLIKDSDEPSYFPVAMEILIPKKK